MHFLTLVQSRPLFSVFAVALSQLTSVAAFKQCYYPDGSVPTDYVWEPCTGAQYSSCCIPSEGDICQPNGLCYYPLNGEVYRGACTDRTWDDPSCPSDICVSGFETTWTWATECDGSGGSKAWACGPVDPELLTHATPTCPAHQASNTAGFVTTTSYSSAGRYTPPPSVDPSLYSVWTSSYTVVITANVQTTTLTSAFASTFTSKLNKAVATTTDGASASSTSSSSSSSSSGAATSKSGGITLSTGALVAIVVGPILAIAIIAGLFFFLRKKRSGKKSEAVRLNSIDYPPPNGPVGADQVNPYEVPSNEVSALPHKYTYAAPKVDTYEVDSRNSMLREKKSASAMELGTEDHESLRSPVSLRSPAPMYNESWAPVELDASPSIRAPNRAPERY